MGTWYIFNKDKECIATMRGAKPSESDLSEREEYAILDEDDLGVAGELVHKGGKVKKEDWVANRLRDEELAKAIEAGLQEQPKEEPVVKEGPNI